MQYRFAVNFGTLSRIITKKKHYLRLSGILSRQLSLVCFWLKIVLRSISYIFISKSWNFYLCSQYQLKFRKVCRLNQHKAQNIFLLWISLFVFLFRRFAPAMEFWRTMDKSSGSDRNSTFILHLILANIGDGGVGVILI